MAVGVGDDVGVTEGVGATVGVDAGDGVGVGGIGVAVSVDVGRGDAERAMLFARAYVADGATGCLFSRDRSDLDKIIHFDSHWTLAYPVLGFVDRGHPTFTNLFHDLVPVDQCLACQIRQLFLPS